MSPTDAARRVGNEATLYPEIEPYASGRIALDRTAHDALGDVRQSRGRAARVPPRRPRRRMPAASPPLLRSRVLPHRALRPARLRRLDTDRVARRQHDATSRRRSRAPARVARHRALGRVRRIVGIDPRARVRAGASRSRARPRAARHLPRDAARDRLVHARHRECLSRGMARLRGVPSARRARRSPRQLLSPADESRTPRCTCLRRRRGTATKARARRSCLSPTPSRSSTATPRRSPSRASRRITSSTTGSCAKASCSRACRRPPRPLHHRPGPLRHRVPADHRRHACPRVAGGGVRRGAGRRALGARAGITRELVAAVRRLQKRLT